MKHSPAEYFIKYLCSRPGVTVQEVKRYLSDMGVGMMPSDRYVANIHAEIQGKFPTNYNPRDRSHRPSSRFLKREKITGLWRGTDSCSRALAIFENGPVRDLVESLLLTSMSNQETAETISYLTSTTVTPESISSFRHYFWNTTLLSFDDWAYFLTTPTVRPIHLTALKSPKNPDGARLTLYKVGIIPPAMDKIHMLTSIRDLSYLNFLEANGFGQGMKKSTMLLNYGSLVKTTQDKLDEYAAGEQDVINEFYKHLQVSSRTGKHKELRELEGEHSDQGARQLPSGDAEGAGDTN